MGINLDYKGYKGEKKSSIIREDEVKNYLEVIGSTNSFYSKNNVAPPIYNVVQEISILEDIWKMNDLHGSEEEMKQNVLMLVHGEQTMNFKRLLRVGEEVTSVASVENIMQKGANYILTLKALHSDSSGDEISDSLWTLFIRAAEIKKDESKPATKKPIPKPTQPKPPREEISSDTFHIEKMITNKYSIASKDHNPIHTDEEIAKKAGLSGIIVHGLCTMAMTMEKLIDNNLNGQPDKLESITLRFSSPVYPGDNLKVTSFSNEVDSSFDFEVENGDKVKVIKSGKVSFKD